MTITKSDFPLWITSGTVGTQFNEWGLLMKNADMPASPVFNSEGFVSNTASCDISFTDMITGLTKREAFAMEAMAGLIAFHGAYGLHKPPGEVARRSIECADALLAELDK
jgi:hypothetical protein